MGKQSKKQLSVSDYEKLGRTLENIFEGGYVNHWRVYRINLVRGIFFGFGSVIGGTLLIATILWLLSFFTELPLIGDFVDTIRGSINEN